MRVLALGLSVVALTAPAASGTRETTCPRDASLGTVRFVRAGHQYVVSLATCAPRVSGPAAGVRPTPFRSADGRFVATVRSTGSGRSARQTIWVTDRRTGKSRPVTSETEHYTRTGPGDTPGPIWLLRFSTNDRWIFFTIDPGGSGSIAADGLVLRVVSAAGGTVHKLGVALPYPDYSAWCGDRVVYTGGSDRVATDAKRLLVAGPPAWRPQLLWPDPQRSFGSVACAPDGRSVAVLTQRSSTDSSFFSTRWQLWQISLDGSRHLLDAPPTGWADESPLWSPKGDALLFVRERRGYGHAMLLRGGMLFGPVANLGYSLGYYGHHAWWQGAAWHE